MRAETSRFSKAFTMAVSWNAFLYIIYKMSFVTLTFLVYKKVSSQLFSEWAAINSIIFLLLLWVNCGLKQSIPRFAPLFGQNKKLFDLFIGGLLIFKLTSLLLSIPLLTYSLQWITPVTVLPLFLIIGVFLSEGIATLLQLIYQAHFWQKQFNLIQTFFLLFEMARNFALLYQEGFAPEVFITHLFISKLFGNLGTIAFSLCFIPLFYRTERIIVTIEQPPSTAQLLRSFIQHSVFMWLTALVQSLSERNFLFPCVRFVQGDLLASMFKVVHDAAIFFQRIIIKTIGVADTALLSYIEVEQTSNQRKDVKAAFLIIFKTIFALCIPLGCAGGLFFFKQQFPELESATVLLFMVISVGSLLEIVLSPYTRILEVKLAYKTLALSYVPYLIGIGLCFCLYTAHLLSLTFFMLLLHFSRLISAGLMVYYANNLYHITLPIRFILLTIALSGSLTALIWLIWH